MTLWLVLVVLAAGAAILVALPFLRARADAGPPTDATEILKAELAQVSLDQAVGEIDAPAADVARLEAERRLLAAAATPAEPKVTSSATIDRVTAGVVIAVVVIGAIALYAAMGKPNLPAAPAMAAGATQPAVAAAPAAAQGLPDVDTMIAGLEQKLKDKPNDVEGWRMLGWSYFSTQKYPQAVAGYAHAVALNPASASLQSAYGEALAKAADGRITPEARKAFDTALKLDPTDQRARSYLGLAVPAAPPAPTPQDVQGASAMTPADQQAMISTMVDKQVRDLAANPRDAEGWARLIRSRKVLGQMDLARKALGDAVAAFKDDPTTQRRLRDTARDLGVS
jgi:cytochrome c-type biogenesis protein CcmH